MAPGLVIVAAPRGVPHESFWAAAAGVGPVLALAAVVGVARFDPRNVLVRRRRVQLWNILRNGRETPRADLSREDYNRWVYRRVQQKLFFLQGIETLVALFSFIAPGLATVLALYSLLHNEDAWTPTGTLLLLGGAAFSLPLVAVLDGVNSARQQDLDWIERKLGIPHGSGIRAQILSATEYQKAAEGDERAPRSG